MKILLITPPSTLMPIERPHVVAPLGLAYIAAVLERDGFDVEILDCVAMGWRRYLKKWKVSEIKTEKPIHFGLSWKEIESKIKKASPDVVGISCSYSCQSPNAHKTAGIVKKANKKTRVVFGGAHPSAFPIKTLKDRNVDYVVIGEGELTVSELVKKLDKGSGVSGIRGIAYREKGRPKINPAREFIQDLDSLPPPARHLLPMEEYFEANSTHGGEARWTPITSMVTSRGCPGNCIFCSIHVIWGHRWRARSPKNVVDEIEHLVKKYGVREIHFEDDNLTLDRRRMIEICDDVVDRGLAGKFRWTTPNGVMAATLDEEVLRKMKAAGCYSLSFGIESGSKRILREVIRKNVPFEKLGEVVKACKKLGIETSGSFILGLPGENEETFRKTINLAKALDLDAASFLAATPFPGTELYDMCVEHGYISKDMEWSEFRTIGSAMITTKSFSRDDILRWQKKAYKEFYFRPKRIMKKIAQNIKSPRSIWRLAIRYKKFVS